MARRSSRGGRSAAARQPRAKSRKPARAAAAEVEVVEEAGGEGIDAGIVILTSVILLVALFFVDALKGKFGDGMFF